MKLNQQIQQGDVTLTRIETMPSGTRVPVPKQTKGFILAEGEATGHHHAIASETDAELVRIGERMLLQLNETATLTHEEHKPISLQPGVYEIGIVQEWDYLQDMARDVVD